MAGTVLAGVIVVGGAATLVAAVSERGLAADRGRRTAERAAFEISESVGRNLAVLQGVRGLAADGVVSPDEFRAFAADAMPGSSLPALAQELVVDEGSRAEFEAEHGVTIKDIDPKGGLGPAAVRPTYAVIVAVYPDTEANRQLLGLDIESDPIRADAAAQAASTGSPVLSAPLALVTTARPGFFGIHAIRSPTQQLVGFVSSGVAVEDLVAKARRQLPTGSRLTVRSGSTVLLDDGERGGTSRVAVPIAGQIFQVAVSGSSDGSYGVALSLGAATALVAALLTLSRRRDRRVTERLAALGARSAELADVAQSLSAATSPDQVIGIIATDMARVVRADYAEVGLVRGDHLLMRVARSPLTAVMQTRYHRVPLDLHLPGTEAVAKREAVFVDDIVDYQHGHPQLQDDARQSHAQAVASLPLVGGSNEVIGVVSFIWRGPAPVSDDLRATLRTLAELCGQTLQRVEIAEAQARAVRRNIAIAALGERLSAAIHRSDITRELLEGAGAVLGAPVTEVAYVEPFGVNGDDAVTTYRSPAPNGANGADAGTVGTTTDASGPVAACLRAGTPLLVPSRAAFRSRYGHDAAETDANGIEKGLYLPLRSHNGATFGVLLAGWTDDDAVVSDDDLTTGETVAQLASRALERAALSDAETQRNESLIALAQGLATVVTAEDLGAVVQRLVPPVLGAAFVVLTVLAHDPPGSMVRLTSERSDAAAAEHDRPVPPAPDLTNWGGERLQLYGRTAPAGQDAPQLEPLGEHAGMAAAAHVPLHDATGTTSGVLTIGWPATVRLDPTMRAGLSIVADLLGQTLERADLYDNEHALVLEFQSRLLSPIPPVDGLETAVRYYPASTAMGIGGDWYDGARLGDGSLVVIVGDVTGHGVEAVALMAQLRSLATGFAHSGMPLGDVLSAVGATLDRRDGPHGSAQLFHVDAARRRLGYVSHGHPYALLRTAAGEVTALRGAQHGLLGVDTAAHPLVYVPFPPGSMLLAYTDGLVERRREVITDQIGRLAERLRKVDAGAPIDEIIDDLVDTTLLQDVPTGRLSDDVATVLVRANDAPPRP